MKPNRFLSVLLLLLGLFFIIPGPRAAATASEQERSGLKTPTLIVEDTFNPNNLFLEKRSTVYSSEWEKYGSYYYYNQLSEKQKAFYDRLSSMCITYMETKADASYTIYNSKVIYTTALCKGTGLSNNDMFNTAVIFYYSNPQYYFLSPYFYISKSGNNSYLSMRVYEKFADGSARSSATAMMKKKIASCVSEIKKQDTLIKKEKKIHDLVVGMVDYESNTYDQSVYSTFLLGKTVCAGYSAAFSLLSNAVGIDSAIVTSYDHAWNYVRLNDSWYYVDCTWDDGLADTLPAWTYTYFNRSKKKFLQVSGRLASHHVEEDFWNNYLPACTLDSGATASSPGTIRTPSSTTVAPFINVTVRNNYNTISISSATKNATIYYTTDGSMPSAASSKSTRYTSSFSVTKGSTIKAIAVCNAFYDSDTSSKTQSVKLYHAYTPTISKQPAAASYAYKTTAKALTVTAKVSDGGTLSYQWYKSKTSNTSNGTAIKNATSYWYKPSTSSLGTMYYYCVVTNTNNHAVTTKKSSKTSSAAKVTITKRSISKAVTGKISDQTYTGKTLKPSPSVKWNGSKLKKNKDYTISYSNNKSIGKATITLTGTGIYSGTKKVTFSIVPKKISIKKITRKRKSLYVSWKKGHSVSGYKIEYSTNKNFTKSTTVKIKKASSSATTISKLKANKGYYVRIRCYKTVKGKNYYSSWSKRYYCKTKK